MKKTYAIKEHVRGEMGATGGAVAFAYDAGEVTPADARESAVLEYLVRIGRAEVVTGAKPTKRSTHKEA